MFRIPDGDNLFRASVRPVSFKGKAFAAQKVIRLEPRPGGRLIGSLAWEKYAPATDHIHGYGCRLAFRMNETLKAEGKFNDKSRRVYCGAFRLKAGAIRSLPSLAGLEEISFANVVHLVERGEIAHTELEIVLKPGANVQASATAIIDRLWNACSGPLKHICDGDNDVMPHPSASLPVAPCGPYSDDRSRITRLWHLVRFRAYSWCWRAFHGRDTD